jgi:hypothetical protein
VVIPIVQAVVAADRDAHGTLPEKSFERHSALPMQSDRGHLQPKGAPGLVWWCCALPAKGK